MTLWHAPWVSSAVSMQIQRRCRSKKLLAWLNAFILQVGMKINLWGHDLAPDMCRVGSGRERNDPFTSANVAPMPVVDVKKK
eukprot:CAMPEP_0172693510 /NCGR_PEP_ID=MMETSP1074-20121228/26042_1 /TAXON_ID=2916 /ORGANISM="Ceratium fusus, Strain PA161109" /LENGTH=81 /DNA_ID=CAMNT_0013513887 /DNA_START=140 /DNA_END=382 /DNA_ORIENTATION=+